MFEIWIFIYGMSVTFDLELRYWKFFSQRLKYNGKECMKKCHEGHLRRRGRSGHLMWL